MQIFLVELDCICHNASSFCFCNLFVCLGPSWSDNVSTCTLWPQTGLGGTTCHSKHDMSVNAGWDLWCCDGLQQMQLQLPPLGCHRVTVSKPGGGETRAHCCLRHGGIKIRKNTSKHKGLTYTHLHCLSRRENEQIFFYSWMRQWLIGLI